VKRVCWTVVMLGLLCVSLASIVPAMDDPETAFNETETPINLTTPVNSRTNFVAPAGDPVVILEKQQAWWNPNTMMHGITLKPGMRSSHSLLNLLCKLLC
jgi:hypothetical protein